MNCLVYKFRTPFTSTPQNSWLIFLNLESQSGTNLGLIFRDTFIVRSEFLLEQILRLKFSFFLESEK